MMAPILAHSYANAMAGGYASDLARRYVIGGMKIVEEVRRERLQMLVTEFGTLSALNEKLGLNARDSTLSQYLNQWTKPGTDKPKVMGSGMARRLEHACGKEIGWMDTDPQLEAAAVAYEALSQHFMATQGPEIATVAPTGSARKSRGKTA